jgi:hypothetical protein
VGITCLGGYCWLLGPGIGGFWGHFAFPTPTVSLSSSSSFSASLFLEGLRHLLVLACFVFCHSKCVEVLRLHCFPLAFLRCASPLASGNRPRFVVACYLPALFMDCPLICSHALRLPARFAALFFTCPNICCASLPLLNTHL